MLCEANGWVLQQAFVMEANHPWCRLCLQNGQEIDTGIMPAGLLPRYAPGPFDPDVDDPFKDIWSEPLVKSGSHGIQIDDQLDSLQRVQHAKEFAKAIKSENIEIPVYLWNKHVEGCANAEQRDKALV